MTDQAMSPLRRRMIEDMTIRKFAAKTQHDYVQRVKNFAAFLGRSPDTTSSEDVRRYQLHLTASGVGIPTLNQTVSTLRFFFKVTLGRPDLVERTAFVHEPSKLPVVLSPEEVARLLDAAPSLKYKAALSVAYGTGLRVSEVVALKIGDIDSKRMAHGGAALGKARHAAGALAGNTIAVGRIEIGQRHLSAKRRFHRADLEDHGSGHFGRRGHVERLTAGDALFQYIGVVERRPHLLLRCRDSPAIVHLHVLNFLKRSRRELWRAGRACARP